MRKPGDHGYKQELGQRIRELRVNQGYTQHDVATRLGLSDSTVRMWELGKNAPDQATLVRVSQLFNCSADHLLGIDETQILGLDNVYFNFAKEAQESGVAPEDIRMALDMIKQLRRG